MYNAPIKEIKFLLKDLFQIEKLFKDTKYESLDEDTLDGILDEVRKLSEKLISPINRDADTKPAFLKNKKVILPKSFNEAYKSIAEGGWVGISGDVKYGGLGLPLIVTTCVNELLSSACLSLALNPLMTQGQIDALESHANEDIKNIFLPKLNSGEWSGTMNLTEPQAGSDVGALRTLALKDNDGTYKITGQKIWISNAGFAHVFIVFAMELTIDQALQRGVAAHKAGNLQEAEKCYKAILKSQPNHSDANHTHHPLHSDWKGTD